MKTPRLLSIIAFSLTLTFTAQVASADDSDRCSRLSAVARAKGVRTLVISFEGLASFSGSSTQAAYNYQHALVSGKKAHEASGFGMGGFVARGLMMPAITRAAQSFEFVVLPYTATGTAETCAQQWMKIPGRRLIIAGHSFGGHAAVRLAEALGQRNVRPDLVITIDPRSVFGTGIYRARSARRWENYYQFGGGLPGKSIREADVNQRLSAGHTKMPFQPEVRRALVNGILR